jgi:hypothetical protein
MKKRLISFALAILFGWLLGCNSNPVQDPVQASNEVSVDGQSIQILELPAPAGISLAKEHLVAQWVDADSGGELEISARFWNTTLTIPKKALSKDQYISMMLDPSTQQIEFGPDGLQFKKPAMLNYTVSGLDLSTVPIGSLVKLYFWNQKTGKFEEMVSESITYDRTAGTLTCVNGEIPHFCIYAFGYIRR